MDDLLIRDFSKLGNSARDNFASAMGSTKLAEAIATDSRLGSRAMERVYLANSVNVRHGAGSPLERRVAAAYVAEPDRIERLCGLALHSHFLRTIVARNHLVANLQILDRHFAFPGQNSGAGGKAGYDPFNVGELDLAATKQMNDAVLVVGAGIFDVVDAGGINHQTVKIIAT